VTIFKNVFFYVILFVFGLSMTNCKPEPPKPVKTEDLYIKNPDSILSRHNEGRPEWDQATLTQGRVQLTVKEDRITISYVGVNATETVNYFLQTEKTAHKLKSDYMARAEVLYLGRSLVVNSLVKKQTLYFHLDGEKIPEDIEDIGDVQSFSGYGLGIRSITHGMQPETVPYCACDHASTPPGNCKAGMNMDMSCAFANDNGGCKVICTGQYYACCDRGFE
jgi:hypothetical protein